MAEEFSASTSPSPTATVSRSSTTTAILTNIPPFEEASQLCTTLTYTYRSAEKSRFLKSHVPDQTLPDAPRIPLDSCQVITHCLADIDTTPMDRLGEKLWWSGPTIDLKPLSEHVTIDFRIQVTEDPTLHCVWTDNIIFIKPLPLYLCSYAFWEYLLDTSNNSISPEERQRLRMTSLGFLKSYARLIQHRSDFNLARKLDLLGSFDGISFEEFTRFIMAFDELPDAAVNIRWRFGELCLDSLNFFSAFYLRKWHRNRYEQRYGAYFQRFFPVVLFMFALFSVSLSAMQVILGGRQLWDTDNKGLKKALGLFEWFSIESIAWSLAFGVLFMIWWICISTAEALKARKTKKGLKEKLKTMVEAVPQA
ncbi:hypothetical protein CC78DRAFT_535068 [Lojkania enalia]|uniref:Uncharacterized protein n=1 Tax=Lojkania enalia TaxID=147567 RepID=A0A9P4K603_9PLEO|nr:hypothetical protein CC78DRAFT_535068 [Didymosphaeria enalia]